ncbi:unnamed protein product [Notodromas monacha]|uniref:DUF3456 domain-containing protein n=1 Tax=Notodromas monacha TaxID=399045 RepID=A0A7R9GGL2_9CRUS|nr:unnamed protein product [Notodromas monacha]CAG0920320.1 unnamed protein product [Notodromas monacha]
MVVITLPVIAFFLMVIQFSYADDELKCLVCRSLVQELNSEIAKVDPKKKINVGTGRLSPDGDIKRNVLPYARSNVHLMDLLETVCGSFDDYVEGHYKDTGERAVVKIMINGQMNPDFSRVEPKLKDDLNKGLKFYCETIVEEFEDPIMKIFGHKSESRDEESDLCMKEAGFCEFHAEEDPYDFEKEEL